MADTSHSICLSSCEAAAASVGLAECRWVEEYHVDGFRFDLASCLCRDSTGTPLEVPPIIRDIAKDPVLSKVNTVNICARHTFCWQHSSVSAHALCSTMHHTVAGV